jgi:hypothetical protein
MSDEQPASALDEDPDVMLDRPDGTGIDRVDAAVDAVAAIGSVPLEEHPRVYEQVHAALRSVLDDPTA